MQVKSYKQLQIYENEHCQINIDLFHVYLRSCIKVYSNTCKNHYLQFSIKCNIRIADEQKYIAQMYAIDFYV